jgi:hypothetical protein
MERGQVFVLPLELMPIFAIALVLSTLFFKNRVLVVAGIFLILAPFTEEFVFIVKGSTVTLAHIVGILGIVYVLYDWLSVGKTPKPSGLFLAFLIFVIVGIVSLALPLSIPITGSPSEGITSPTQRGLIELARFTFSVGVGVFLVWAGSQNLGTAHLVRIHVMAGALHSFFAIGGLLLAIVGAVGESYYKTSLEYYWPGRVNPWRFTGLQEEPKNFAFYLLTTLAVSIFLWIRHDRRLWGKLPLLPLIAIQFIALLGSVSFAAFVAATLGGVGFIIGLMFATGLSSVRSLVLVMVKPVLVTALLGVLTVFAVSLSSSSVNSFWSDQWSKLSDYNSDTTSGRRFDRYQSDAKAFAQYPILGVGFGRYPYYFEHFRPADTQGSGFSGNQSFVSGVPAGTGILGAGMLLAIAYITHRNITQNIRPNWNRWNQTRLVSYFLFWILIGILMTHDESRKMYVVVAFALVLLTARNTDLGLRTKSQAELQEGESESPINST